MTRPTLGSAILMFAAAAIIHLAGCTPVPRYLVPDKKAPEAPLSAGTSGARRQDVSIAIGHPLQNLGPHRVSSTFGIRVHPVYGTRDFHHGIDLRAEIGEGVYAAADGIVAFSGRQRRYGKVVIIEHGQDVSTVYAHLSETAVSQGQRIAGGRRIGRVGVSGNATGPHLHFEIRVSGKSVDPLEYLVFR